MAKERYLCSHCGKRFEAEEKETVECPSCFWSSSVKKEEAPGKPAGKDGLVRNVQPPSVKNVKPSSDLSLPELRSKILLFAGIVLFFVALAFLVVYLAPFVRTQIEKAKEQKPKTDIKGPQEVPAEETSLSRLSENDRQILSQVTSVQPYRIPSEAEKKILDSRVVLKTGFVEKLPSPIWTVQQFEELLDKQEKLYEVPLPNSYRRKLVKLFETKYMPSAQAFENEKILEARNFWVEALAFPIYANNIQMHRGVVLTMLRPFIEDTLAKISVINNQLVEKQIQNFETEISQIYQRLAGLIHLQSWAESLKAVSELENEIKKLEKTSTTMLSPPSYPDGIAFVDDGIRATLFDLLTAQPPVIADLGPLKEDLAVKKEVIQSFLPEYVEKNTQAYQKGLEAVSREEWPEAAEAFSEVKSPLMLKEDAERKLGVLKKLQK